MVVTEILWQNPSWGNSSSLSGLFLTFLMRPDRSKQVIVVVTESDIPCIYPKKKQLERRGLNRGSGIEGGRKLILKPSSILRLWPVGVVGEGALDASELSITQMLYSVCHFATWNQNDFLFCFLFHLAEKFDFWMLARPTIFDICSRSSSFSTSLFSQDL